MNTPYADPDEPRRKLNVFLTEKEIKLVQAQAKRELRSVTNLLTFIITEYLRRAKL